MMHSHLTDLPKLRDLQSRCISPENPTGGKGMGATEGNGWKGAPFVRPFPKDSTVTMADIVGPGTLPVTEDPEIPYDTIALPSFTRSADELIAQHELAFRKVALQTGDLSDRVSAA